MVRQTANPPGTFGHVLVFHYRRQVYKAVWYAAPRVSLKPLPAVLWRLDPDPEGDSQPEAATNTGAEASDFAILWSASRGQPDLETGVPQILRYAAEIMDHWWWPKRLILDTLVSAHTSEELDEAYEEHG